MRLVARYHDGFTERGLSWRLEVNEGQADFEAGWLCRFPPLKVTFPIDEEIIRSALPLLSGIEGDYQAQVTDLEQYHLNIVDGEMTIRRDVYGASHLLGDHPELEDYLEFWRVLEGTFADRLSAHIGEELGIDYSQTTWLPDPPGPEHRESRLLRPAHPRLTLVDLMAAIGACALGLAVVARAAPGRYAPALMVVAPLVGILWDRRGGGRGIRGGAVGGFLHAAISLPFFLLGPVRAGLPGSWPAAYAGATVVCVAFGAMMGVATWLTASVMGRTSLARPSETG